MSAKDPIEELFRDNQHGLDEQPRGLLWDKIEESLDEKQIVSRKLNWWKYAAAACLVAGLSFASYLFLYDSNLPAVQNSESEIVHQPTEVTQENASEILDKIEEQKQSIVTNEKLTEAPEIYKEDEIIHPLKTVPQMESYDIAPAATMAYEPVPSIKEYEVKAEENIFYENEKMADESIVFRGETPEKKGKNVITRKDDSKRMGNMSESSVMYGSAVLQNQISVPVKNNLIQYDLVSQTDSSVVFKNGNVSYPNQIILTQTNDSVRVIYSGKENKKNSNESQKIQKYIRENKSQIASDFGLK